MNVALLTGGGDCPGLNAVIRAVTRQGLTYGWRLTGIRDGWRGLLEKAASMEEINQAVKAAAEGPMAGVLEHTEAPLVSADIVGNPHSSVFDSKLTMASGRQAKIVAWYDNEWGFANRM